ncbi:MAG TPA: DUF72 domain-containing protein [Allosphingosinicella sp.]|nr:DUF72 domain-containing protein [Allosphingosinicella sp.]
MRSEDSLFIGTAGWSIPPGHAEHFGEGSSLKRYSRIFRGAEINSSFHRSHRPATWLRWAESVPDRFRFSVKMPKAISHERKLVDCDELVGRFLEEVSPLADKLAILLLQLPPKLEFDPDLIERFLAHLLPLTSARLVCEPRHPSWFESEPGALLDRFGIARVAADPARVPLAATPGGWRGLTYLRLHGSPIMYRSSYDEARLADYAAMIRADLDAGRDTWCMFDNTASSAAAGDALALMTKLDGKS